MRLAYTTIVFLFLFIAPWWLYLPLVFAGVVIFPFYLEAMALALLADMLYGGAGHGAYLLSIPFTALSALSVAFALPLRQYLRFNA
jgi:hypothetical protein